MRLEELIRNWLRPAIVSTGFVKPRDKSKEDIVPEPYRLLQNWIEGFTNHGMSSLPDDECFKRRIMLLKMPKFGSKAFLLCVLDGKDWKRYNNFVGTVGIIDDRRIYHHVQRTVPKYWASNIVQNGVFAAFKDVFLKIDPLRYFEHLSPIWNM